MAQDCKYVGGVCYNLIEESGRPQWPPFRGELADLEADSSFSPIWYHRTLSPELQKPPRGTRECELKDDVGLSHCP